MEPTNLVVWSGYQTGPADTWCFCFFGHVGLLFGFRDLLGLPYLYALKPLQKRPSWKYR
jgi:hypothetical protein